MIKNDPLDALNDRVDVENNTDMFLNLHNIEGVEISTNSVKINRCEDGEEATSHGS